MKLPSLHSAKILDIFVLAAGILITLAFAPHRIFLLAIISPTIFLLTIVNATIRQTLWRAGLYSLGYFGIGLSWIYFFLENLRPKTTSQIFISVCIFLIMLAFIASFIGSMYLFTCFFKKNHWTKYVIGFPVAWVFFEWFCSWFLTGLPWLLLGQSQASTWLGAYAPVISTYGVSFMVVVIAGLIVNAIIFKKYWLNSFIIASIILTGALLNHISWTTPVTKDPLKVALIQGNIPMTMITTVANVETAFIRYLDLTKKNIDAQLIVLPESAFLIHEDDIPIYFNYLNKLLVTHHAAMITGIAYQDRTTHESFGAAKVFGEGYGIYFKQHLVPLGEYMPFSHYLPKDFRLLNYFPIANITAGKSQQPLMMVQHIPVGTVLCNDLTYIPVILNKLPAAQLLVSLNNLSWYGHSWGAAQQLQIAQMRALEAGRYLLVVGNDGVTAIIDNHGRIVGSIPRFSVQVLRGEVYPMQGSTPLVIIGWIPLFLLALAWGIIGFFLNRRAKL